MQGKLGVEPVLLTLIHTSMVSKDLNNGQEFVQRKIVANCRYHAQLDNSKQHQICKLGTARRIIPLWSLLSRAMFLWLDPYSRPQYVVTSKLI